MNTLAEPEYKKYFNTLLDETGCLDYRYSSTPYRMGKVLFDRLNCAIPLILDLIDTPEYLNHCAEQNNWSLHAPLMKRTDYTGCADFLLTTSGAKLIEININIPGKIGLMQQLGESAQKYLGYSDANWTNLDFNERLVSTIQLALPNSKHIAILVSHLESSKEHFPHYQYFSEQLNKMGLQTKVVAANDIELNDQGFTSNGQHFDSFINLVIPFVWEDNQSEFRDITTLLQRFPDRIFPNPTGGMLGTKDLLCYLSKLRHTGTSKDWSEFILEAQPMSDFHTLSDLIKTYDHRQLVLKPLKDYNSTGVYIQPDLATLERVYNSERDRYMVQAFTTSLEETIVMESGVEIVSPTMIYRAYFASKVAFGCQIYYLPDGYDSRYVTAPIIVD